MDKKKKVIELLSGRALSDKPVLPGTRDIERGVVLDAQRRVCNKKKLKSYLYTVEHNDPTTTDAVELELRKAIRNYITPAKKIGSPK